jgi:hypothetical protein
MPDQKTPSEFEDPGFPFQEYLEDSESQEDFTVQETGEQNLPQILSGTFEERLAILKEAIEEIDSEIDVRKELSKSFQFGLKDARDWLTKSLREFEQWQFGYKPSVDFRRTALERELLGVYREARTERQRAFTDIVALKKERRKLLMEYKSLKATGQMLSKE